MSILIRVKLMRSSLDNANVADRRSFGVNQTRHQGLKLRLTFMRDNALAPPNGGYLELTEVH